jgi:hypothetical protein
MTIATTIATIMMWCRPVPKVPRTSAQLSDDLAVGCLNLGVLAFTASKLESELSLRRRFCLAADGRAVWPKRS